MVQLVLEEHDAQASVEPSEPRNRGAMYGGIVLTALGTLAMAAASITYVSVNPRAPLEQGYLAGAHIPGIGLLGGGIPIWAINAQPLDPEDSPGAASSLVLHLPETNGVSGVSWSVAF